MQPTSRAALRRRPVTPRAHPAQLSDAELLGRVLGYGPQSALSHGNALLGQAGSIAGLMRLNDGALHWLQTYGAGPARRFELLRELHRRVLHPQKVQRLCSLQDVLLWAQPHLVHLEHEELWLLCLDAKNGLRSAQRVAQGGIHGCSVTPRDVLRPAVRNAAAAVVVVHNHPSGDPTPSAEDLLMTESLAQACNVLGVPLLDHVVVAAEGACSAAALPGATHLDK